MRKRAKEESERERESEDEDRENVVGRLELRMGQRGEKVDRLRARGLQIGNIKSLGNFLLQIISMRAKPADGSS